MLSKSTSAPLSVLYLSWVSVNRSRPTVVSESGFPSTVADTQLQAPSKGGIVEHEVTNAVSRVEIRNAIFITDAQLSRRLQPKFNDPACGTHGLKPECDSRVRWRMVRPRFHFSIQSLGIAWVAFNEPIKDSHIAFAQLLDCFRW